MFKKEDYFFRVTYKKLETECKLSNALRSDLKFKLDSNSDLVFSLYPEFETLSDKAIVGNELEATGEGTAIIRKPIYDDRNGYYDMIRERVSVGATGWLVSGSHKIAEIEIIEIISSI